MNTSTLPDPNACGTCRALSASGRPIAHDECAARAVLLEAPDQPSYEDLVDLTEEQRAALPARFHTPHFDDLGKPHAWLCRVCWGDGWSTQWPCKTAVEHGAEVFTPDANAGQALETAAAEIERLRARVAELEAERHATNEALSEAAETLWANRDRIAALETEAVCLSRMTTSRGVSKCVLPIRHRHDHHDPSQRHYWSDEYADKPVTAPLSQMAAEVIAERSTTWVGARQDRYESPLHTTYATPHDLPEPEVNA
ncbi:hypothetical protein [Streptomyces sp. NPDC101145]|uniref:hypothetical protein n=1 Tax=Streptomyces sp. NPDC101145 TaxID=3366112 RepID=UPI0038079092